jgi:AcrR family transcriptional regulator
LPAFRSPGGSFAVSAPVGFDTGQYADTHRYVNTLEYYKTVWYPSTMPDRLTRQERKTQTRERLIDAAARVFAEKGLEAASLDEVAAAAGYTKGAVYSNFSSKTDLVIALLEHRIASQSAMLESRFGGKDLATVAGELRPRTRMADAERQFLILVVEFWLHAMRDERARRLVAEQYERARDAVAARLLASGYREPGMGSAGGAGSAGSAGGEGGAGGAGSAGSAGGEGGAGGGRLTAREMAMVTEALGTGIALQSALDPERVPVDVVARALKLLLAAAPSADGSD